MRLAALLCLLIGTSPALACPDTPHRFETFSLPAPALGHAKRILVYLPPGCDCTDRRYPVWYLNDGHDLFAWDPLAANLEPALAPEIGIDVLRVVHGARDLDALDLDAP